MATIETVEWLLGVAERVTKEISYPKLREVYRSLGSACKRYIWVHRLHDEGIVSFEDFDKERNKLEEIVGLTKNYWASYLKR